MSPCCHSVRRAVRGSTFVALRAGRYDASSAETVRTSGATAKTTGSSGLTSYNIPLSIVVISCARTTAFQGPPVPDTSRYLIQILLPVYDNEGRAFGEAAFAPTRAELTERFGGLTAYLRAPARGLWKTEQGTVERDDIAIFEVMSERRSMKAGGGINRARLEARFRQDLIVVRATAITVL